MGGERRRRRLRRTGRTPFEAPAGSQADEPGAPDPPAAIDEPPPGPEERLRPTSAEPPADGERDATRDRRPRPNGGRGPRPGATQHRPSPADLADLAGPFALTAGVQDPEPAPPPVEQQQHHDHRFDDPAGERGLRGLVGGGSSQVNVAAAMRARDASRPTDDDLAAAEADLPIVRRGWVPRDELPRPH